ncbi:mediator of RNA polymerase II transcription subunit 1-like, partial [Salarias fasciatus]|uniref:mediator of RNA polymerase II transcription subunit 1-like n=1 Tax=Salarias fasciatus TaxID=181472 RepID=UPI0011768A1F
MENSVIAALHRKFEDRRWNETSQLVQRCMEKSRDASKPCEPLIRALRRLQEVISMSLNCMMSCLEMIGKDLGVGFHRTVTTCYLTADLFYVEVTLLPCGTVTEVIVAPHGKPPTVSQNLLHLLRLQRFSDFSVHLEALFAQYNLPGNKETKLKLLTSLQCLEKDFTEMSHLLGLWEFPNFHENLINNGMLGILIANKEDYPLSIKFFVPPSDGSQTSGSCMEAFVHTAQVIVGASEVSHKLQMASVLLQPPQLNVQRRPVFLSIDAVRHET